MDRYDYELQMNYYLEENNNLKKGLSLAIKQIRKDYAEQEEY